MPVALGEVVNKIALETYRDTPATWRKLSAIKSAKDFKTHTGIRLNAVAEFERLPETGEFSHATLGEQTYTFAVDTYGKIVKLDRQSIINDDASILADVAASLGNAAARRLSDLVFQVLLANAGGFFASGNGNYISGASTNLSSSALSTARQPCSRNATRTT